MPSAQLPAPTWALATGLSDSNWIGKVRDLTEDWPNYKLDTKQGDGVSGIRGANSAPYKTSNYPLSDTDSLGASVTPFVTVANTSYTVVTSGTPIAGQVLVVLDSGELIFHDAPTTGQTVNAGYYVVRWRDQKILDALYEGLHRMWPAVGRYYTDTTILNQVVTWDYQLPQWCQYPESQILEVWIRDPDINVLPWRSLNGAWRRADPYTIHFYSSQSFSPIARYKIHGWGPCLTLADLPPVYFDLPVWFAAGSLLSKKDAPRARADAMTPQVNEGAAQVGAQAALGAQYLSMFDKALQEIKEKRSSPIGSGLRLVNAYSRYAR